MTGLLLKDLMNFRRQWKIYLLIVSVWIALCMRQETADFLGGMMAMLTVMLPINAIAYDEKAHWDGYALTMPFARRDLVTAKYLLLLPILCVSLLLPLGLGLIMGESLSQLLGALAASSSVALILAAITLPLLLKFGVEKGRLMLMAAVMLGVFLPSLAVQKADDLEALSFLNQPWLLLPAALAAIAASYSISVKIYEKKEF